MRIIAVFDGDGTLIDTMKLHGELAVSCILKHFGGSRDETLRKYHETTGRPFPKQLEILFPGEENAEKRRLCTEEHVARKRKEVYENVHVFDDIKSGVSLIRKAGIVCMISTSTERGIIKNILEKDSVAQFFDVIKGYEDGPKVEHLQAIVREHKPDKIFFIGDSPYDMSLHVHGVITIGRNGNQEYMHPEEELRKSGASFVTDDFRELCGFMLK